MPVTHMAHAYFISPMLYGFAASMPLDLLLRFFLPRHLPTLPFSRCRLLALYFFSFSFFSFSSLLFFFFFFFRRVIIFYAAAASSFTSP